jgi:hypothetical protein
MGWTVGFRASTGSRYFLFCTVFVPALGPNYAPIQWVPGAVKQGKMQRGLKLIIDLHLMSRTRMVEL